jgi:hypothetical protein
MKIDFNKQGLAIQFDKVPKFLYFNESGNGCGAIFIDGQRIKGLIELNIHSETLDGSASPKPLRYFIKRRKADALSPETMGNSKIPDFMTAKVKIVDLEPFKSAIKQFANDDRIPVEIRQEYADCFQKSCESERK